MPHGKTKFCTAWLQEEDNQGHRVGEWCVRDKFSVYKGYCFLCSKFVACENTGKLQLIQHAQGKKHKERMKLKYSSAQSHFRIAELEKRNKTVSSTKSSSQQGEKHDQQEDTPKPKAVLQEMTLRDQITKAEILWSMKLQVRICHLPHVMV